MTVQDLINQLNEVENKNMTVNILVQFGRDCWSMSDDVRVSHPEEEQDGITLIGEESRNDSE